MEELLSEGSTLAQLSRRYDISSGLILHWKKRYEEGGLGEGPKQVPDRQMGQPSFVLGGQYPITGYYVNPRSVFRQGWTLAKQQ